MSESESIEMAAVPDSYNHNSCQVTETDLASSVLGETDITIRSEKGEEDRTPDAGSVQAAAQDACSDTKTVECNVNVAVNVQRQNAGRISTRAQNILVLFGGIIMVLMFGLAIYLVFGRLK